MKEVRKSKRKRRERWGNRMALVGITFVVMSMAVVVNTRGAALRQKDLEYQAKVESLLLQLEQEQAREARLQLEQQRMSEPTIQHRYIEKVAKEKLGLVYPDEILLKPIQ